MKKEDRDFVTLLVLQYLNLYTDQSHPASLSTIQNYLEEYEIEVDRRVIYRIFHALEDAGYPLVRLRTNKQFTYYLEHDFSSGEAFALLDAIHANRSLSKEEKTEIIYKLEKLLSINEKNVLPKMEQEEKETENQQVLGTISTLLEAIQTGSNVSFVYYDLDVHHKKQYRHNKEPYVYLPLHVLGENGRYYCVFWAEKYQKALNFRIDKMEEVTPVSQADTIPTFDLQAYLRNTFHAFTGQADTIQATFPKTMSSLVLDQFSKQMIVTKETEDTFTVSIRTAITPTVIGWFLQFQEQVQIHKPASMIDQMKQIAESILQKYQ